MLSEAFKTFSFRVVLTAALLLASLQSFYFQSAGGAVFVFVGAAIMIGLAALNGRAEMASSPAIRFGVVCVAASIPVALMHNYATGEGVSSAGVFICATMLVAVPIALYGRELEVMRALTIVVSFHLTLFFFQIAWFYAGGGFLDYIALTGRESVWLSQKGYTAASHLIPRFTGAFNEPGTYAGVVAAMVGARYLVARKSDPVFWVGILTLGITASMTGLILSAGLLGAVAIDFLKKHHNAIRAWHIIVLSVLSTIALAFIVQRFQHRITFTGGAEDTAIRNLAWLFSGGSGTSFGHAMEDLPDFVSYEYFGVWMGAYVQFGMSGLAAIGYFLLPAALVNPAIFAVLLLAKIKFTYPMIYMLAGCIIANRRDVMAYLLAAPPRNRHA